MTRIVLLIVWLAIAATALIHMTAAITGGQWHLLLTWSNTAALAALAWYATRESARMQRWETFLGTWNVANPGRHRG